MHQHWNATLVHLATAAERKQPNKAKLSVLSNAREWCKTSVTSFCHNSSYDSYEPSSQIDDLNTASRTPKYT